MACSLTSMVGSDVHVHRIWPVLCNDVNHPLYFGPNAKIRFENASRHFSKLLWHPGAIHCNTVVEMPPNPSMFWDVICVPQRFIEEKEEKKHCELDPAVKQLRLPKNYEGRYQPGLYDVCGPPLRNYMPWATLGHLVATILVPLLAVTSSQCEGTHEILAKYPHWWWLPFFLWVFLMVLLAPRRPGLSCFPIYIYLYNYIYIYKYDHSLSLQGFQP